MWVTFDLKSFFPREAFSFTQLQSSFHIFFAFLFKQSLICAMRFSTSFVVAAGLSASVFAAPISDDCDLEAPNSSAADGN